MAFHCIPAACSKAVAIHASAGGEDHGYVLRCGWDVGRHGPAQRWSPPKHPMGRGLQPVHGPGLQEQLSLCNGPAFFWTGLCLDSCLPGMAPLLAALQKENGRGVQGHQDHEAIVMFGSASFLLHQMLLTCPEFPSETFPSAWPRGLAVIAHWTMGSSTMAPSRTDNHEVKVRPELKDDKLQAHFQTTSAGIFGPTMCCLRTFSFGPTSLGLMLGTSN